MIQKYIYIYFLSSIYISGITIAYPEKLGQNAINEVGENLEGVTQEEEDESRPYSFAWKASRYYNGNPDREHIEERDENGITRGVYRFVDPLQKIQEVVYFSDDTGFHVDASNLPKDTPTVAAARVRHFELFEQIKRDHERLAKELERDSNEEQSAAHQ